MSLGTRSREILELLEAADKIQPVAVKDGVKIVSYREQILLSEADMVNKEYELRERKYNYDGSVARTNKKYCSINMDTLFNNRYRMLPGKKIQVVIDYRALKDQATGMIYTKEVLAYEISRNKTTQELELNRIVMISDDEFVNSFKKKLGKQGMLEILPVIEAAGSTIDGDTLDI